MQVRLRAPCLLLWSVLEHRWWFRVLCISRPYVRRIATIFCVAVRSFDHDSGVCIIRVGREPHRMLRASLTLLAGPKDARLSVTVEAVAGERREKRGGMAISFFFLE